MRYQFIAQHRHEYPIALMCRVLEVSVSGYYAWMKRPPSRHSREDAELAENVKTIFQTYRGVYGSPRVHAELQDQGVKCARKRVARLMREQELFAKRPRHRTTTTKSEPDAQVAPNVLQRDFSAEQPNTRVGSRYDIHLDCAGVVVRRLRVLDLFSRMVARLVHGCCSRCDPGHSGAPDGDHPSPPTGWIATSQ